MPRPVRRWPRTLGWVALGIGVLAALGVVFSAFLFSRWSDVRTVSPAEAETEFAAVVERTGPAYLEVTAGGTVQVNRALEGNSPAELEALHLLGWEPARGALVRIAFPMWFVRVKMNRTVNLGTVTSALAGDWGNLDLTVSVEELELRGPGLVLDQRLQDGSRILLWTEASSPD